jgi:hypothetical protein
MMIRPGSTGTTTLSSSVPSLAGAKGKVVVKVNAADRTPP